MKMMAYLRASIAFFGPGAASADLPGDERDAASSWEQAHRALAEGNHEHAIDAFRSVLKVTAPNVPARLSLANLLSAAGQHAEAIEELDRALTYEAQNTQASSMKGQIEAACGRLDAAIDSFRSVLAIDSTNNASRVGLANMLSATGERSSAIAELETVLRQDPGDTQARIMKGQIEAAMGRLAAAALMFEECLSLTPDHPVVIDSLIQIYRAQMRHQDLVLLLRKWVQRDGASEQNWRDLGLTSWERAEEVRATSVFTDAEEGCPAFENTLAAEREILSEAEGEPGERALARVAEMWAFQLAAQRAVLGRLDTLMQFATYQQSQGRMRVLALNLLQNGIKSFAPWSKPLHAIPGELRDRFSMNDRVEIVDGFVDSTLSAECRELIADEHVQGFLFHNLHGLPPGARDRATAILAGYSPSHHPEAKKAFERSQPLLSDVEVNGKRLAVVEERDLFLESICVALGAETTAVRLQPVENSSRLLKAEQLAEWLASDDRYDLIICRWLIESWGLGRHNEPIDPDGDLTLLARIRAKLDPGGRLIMTPPLGRDRLIFNAMRVYGAHRWPILMAGFVIDSDAAIGQSLLARKVARRRVIATRG